MRRALETATALFLSGFGIAAVTSSQRRVLELLLSRDGCRSKKERTATADQESCFESQSRFVAIVAITMAITEMRMRNVETTLTIGSSD